MLAGRVLGAIVAVLLLQDTPPSKPPAAPAISVVQMQASSTWTQRDGAPYDYRITLRADGTASFSGQRVAQRHGEYSAKLHPLVFKQLTELLRDLGADQFERSYSADGVYDASTISITLTYDDGRSWVVQEYAGSGPIRLWGLQQVIWGMSEQLRWLAADQKGEPK